MSDKGTKAGRGGHKRAGRRGWGHVVVDALLDRLMRRSLIPASPLSLRQVDVSGRLLGRGIWA